MTIAANPTILHYHRSVSIFSFQQTIQLTFDLQNSSKSHAMPLGRIACQNGQSQCFGCTLSGRNDVVNYPPEKLKSENRQNNFRLTCSECFEQARVERSKEGTTQTRRHRMRAAGINRTSAHFSPSPVVCRPMKYIVLNMSRQYLSGVQKCNGTVSLVGTRCQPKPGYQIQWVCFQRECLQAACPPSSIIAAPWRRRHTPGSRPYCKPRLLQGRAHPHCNMPSA